MAGYFSSLLAENVRRTWPFP